MKLSHVSIVVFSLLAPCGAQTYSIINWTTLGADATLIGSANGQTFTDIGTTLSLPDFVGVNLKLTFVGDAAGPAGVFAINGTTQTGANFNSTGNSFYIIEGRLDFQFSNTVGVQLRHGGGIAYGETDYYIGNGELISTHDQPGLVVVNDPGPGQDSIQNPILPIGGSTISTGTPLWQGEGSRFSIGGDDNGFSGGNLRIAPAPEPSSALLSLLGALTLVIRRR